MQVITRQQAVALPGTCIFCPGSVRDRFVDTGIQVEWYGAIIICEQCVTSMGQMFGMATRGQVSDLETIIVEKMDIIFSLQTQLAALEGVRDALAAGGWVAPDGTGVLDVPSSDGEGTSNSASPRQGDVGAQGGATPEQVHDEGLAELRSDERNSGVLNI